MMVTLTMMIWPAVRPVMGAAVPPLLIVVEVRAPYITNSPLGVSLMATAHDFDATSAVLPWMCPNRV